MVTNISSLDASNPLAKLNDIPNLEGLPKVNVDNPLQSGITETVGDVKIPDDLDKAKALLYFDETELTEWINKGKRKTLEELGLQ